MKQPDYQTPGAPGPPPTQHPHPRVKGPFFSVPADSGRDERITWGRGLNGRGPGDVGVGGGGSNQIFTWDLEILVICKSRWNGAGMDQIYRTCFQELGGRGMVGS